jgi:hypothetical protein
MDIESLELLEKAIKSKKRGSEGIGIVSFGEGDEHAVSLKMAASKLVQAGYLKRGEVISEGYWITERGQAAYREALIDRLDDLRCSMS